MVEFATLFEVFKKNTETYSKNVALGYKVEGNYKTISYKRLLEEVNRCVTGLKKLGIKSGDKVAIFSKNRPEWVNLDLALNKIGAISVPIHTTLSPKIIKYIIQDSGAQYIAIGDLFSKFQEIENQVELKKIITFNKIEWKNNLIYFNDLLKEEPDDFGFIKTEFCTIIYTSGTTGNPKGVKLTNKNFIENIKAAAKFVPYKSSDIFLSFLPMSHVLERTGGYYAVLYHGASMYFAESPKTIGDDIKLVKPTVIVSVPRIFEKVYDKVMDKVRSGSKSKQKLFFNSLHISRKYLTAQKEDLPQKSILKLRHYLADKLVLKKVRQSLGGRLRFSISGGGSLNQSIAKFFEAIGLKILEGYGLTETSPIIAVNPIDDYKFGTVGKVVEGVEVKITDDKEILVKGHNVMLGYNNCDDLTKESFTSDGYFKTGDLGYIDDKGFLTIIGRKKEMIVTSTGKNVNPVNLENALQENKYIFQTMVYGDKQKYISALVVPDFEELQKYADKNKINLEIFELIKDERILDFYKAEINNQLNDFPENERIRSFKLLDKEFSEERDELTPTLKLRRERILGNYFDK